MSEGLYYNRRDWIAPVLSNEILEKLDERYVNTDEVISTREIELLYVKYITMIDPAGYIEYADGTRQYTAVSDNLDDDNIYSGSNTYNGMTILNGESVFNGGSVFNGESKLRSLFIEDGVNNKRSKIYQQGNILIIDNNNLSSKCHIAVYNENGLTRSYVFDFGTLSGINDIRIGNRIFVGVSSVMRELGNIFVFHNTQNNGGVGFLVTNANGSQRQITFNGNGRLTGVMEAEMLSIIVGDYFFQSSTSLIKMSKIGNNLVIENRRAGGLIIFQGNANNDGLRIDEFINVSGINDLTIRGRKITINTLEHVFENNLYTIDNKGFLTRIEIRNYDNGGVMRKIEIDSFMNMSGVNDLYVQRIFFGGILFNPNDVNTLNNNINVLNNDVNNLKNKTSQIIYADNGALQQTGILKQSNNRGVMIVPDAIGGNYNDIVQLNDTAIVHVNNAPGAAGALTLTNWASTKSGIRIKSNETEAYNLKVLDGGLKFQDNSVQTTAMTESYLTSLIQNVVSQMPMLSVPVGTILPYGGLIAPPGYYLCDGSSKSVSENLNLFNVIGHSFYVEGRTTILGHFTVPDLRGAYLKGCGSNTMWEHTVPIVEPGWKQNANVGHHAHKYTDRGVNSRNVFTTTGSPVSVVQPSNGNYWTDGLTYHSSSRVELDAENRPNSIGVNYIIKF